MFELALQEAVVPVTYAPPDATIAKEDAAALPPAAVAVAAGAAGVPANGRHGHAGSGGG